MCKTVPRGLKTHGPFPTEVKCVIHKTPIIYIRQLSGSAFLQNYENFITTIFVWQLCISFGHSVICPLCRVCVYVKVCLSIFANKIYFLPRSLSCKKPFCREGRPPRRQTLQPSLFLQLSWQKSLPSAFVHC